MAYRGGGGVSDDLLQQLLDMEVESQGLSCGEKLVVSRSLRGAGSQWEAAVDLFCDWIAANYPVGNITGGMSAAGFVYDHEAAYLLLMTLRGEGVGIWDGSWDDMFDRMTIESIKQGAQKDRYLMGAFEALQTALGDEAAAAESFVDVLRADSGGGEWSALGRREWRSEVEASPAWYRDKDNNYCKSCGERLIARWTLGGHVWSATGPFEDWAEAEDPRHCAEGELCLERITFPDGTHYGAYLGTDLDHAGVGALCHLLATLPLASTASSEFYLRALWAYLFQNEIRAGGCECECRREYGYPHPPGYRGEETPLAIPPPTEVEEILEDISRVRSGKLTSDEATALALRGDELSEPEMTGLQRYWQLPVEPRPYYGGMRARPPRILGRAVQALRAGYGVPPERVQKDIVGMRRRRPRLREGYDYNPRPFREWFEEHAPVDKETERRLEGLAERIERLRVDVQSAYEKAERSRRTKDHERATELDAELEVLEDELEHALEALRGEGAYDEREAEEDLGGEELGEEERIWLGPQPQQEAAAIYHDWLRTQTEPRHSGRFYEDKSEAALAHYLRHYWGEGKVKKRATDAQLIAAARDAYEAELAHRERLGASTVERDARPRLPAYRQGIEWSDPRYAGAVSAARKRNPPPSGGCWKVMPRAEYWAMVDRLSQAWGPQQRYLHVLIDQEFSRAAEPRCFAIDVLRWSENLLHGQVMWEREPVRRDLDNELVLTAKRMLADQVLFATGQTAYTGYVQDRTQRKASPITEQQYWDAVAELVRLGERAAQSSLGYTSSAASGNAALHAVKLARQHPFVNLWERELDVLRYSTEEVYPSVDWTNLAVHEAATVALRSDVDLMARSPAVAGHYARHTP